MSIPNRLKHTDYGLCAVKNCPVCAEKNSNKIRSREKFIKKLRSKRLICLRDIMDDEKWRTFLRGGRYGVGVLDYEDGDVMAMFSCEAKRIKDLVGCCERHKKAMTSGDDIFEDDVAHYSNKDFVDCWFCV